MSHMDYPDASTLDMRVRLHELCSTNPYGWQRWVMDHMGPFLRGRVLEVGTGPAYVWEENANRLPPDIQLVLSDRSSGMLQDARVRLRHAGVVADWLHCDASMLPLGDSCFDTVIANHMLFLLENPANAVGGLARCLRPGGILCATTNHRDHLQDLMQAFIELSPDHFGHLAIGEARQRRERFNFISGAELLLPHFVDIQLATYEDGLQIDQADILGPWLDYWATPKLEAGIRQDLLESIADRIAREGVLRVRKNSGMFIARKPG